MLPPVYTTTTTTLLALLLLLTPLPTPTTAANHHHHHLRRFLHQPFFPVSSPSPSPSPSLHSPPNTTITTNSTTHPKFPFSDSSTPPTTTTTSTDTPTTASDSGNPFFPSYSTPPPPPPPSSTTIPTFPANISSLALPSSASHSSHSPVSPRLVATLVILCLLAVSLITSLAVLLRRKNHRDAPDSADNVRLFPSNAPTSDGGLPPKLPTSAVSHTSSEFLYLGTIATSREFEPPTAMEGPSEVYLKLCGSGSPELKPLPPLPKQSFHVRFQDETENSELEEEVKGEDEEFFSPTASSSVYMVFHTSPRQASVYEESDNFGSKSGNSSFRRSITSSPVNMEARSPASGCRSSPSRDSEISVEIQELLAEAAAAKPMPHAPPPPPPPPPARSWVNSGSGSGSGSVSGPPPLVPPSGPVVFQRSGALSEGSGEKNGETNGKPKLKALHWDKVRASSDRVMVWDQLKPGSFQLNEEMIETLFKVNGAKDGARRSIMPLLNEETRVLDPKKSQNVAILLKALNVTEEEVCEALLEGNADTLGTELLESLLKMAPTKEEEMKLKEYNDESPLKLGPAEKFLKAVLNVPFAFKRVDAMLYIATFESEVEYIKKSFETLEMACQELRNSRMFLKLLEAVLKTGNRMNVGTNRGDAQAFKLDTLLKLVDIKGTDGKTTLLHFVVQEIIKAEGTRLSYPNDNPTAPNIPDQTATHDDIDSRKRGLEVVAGLGGELTHVKKAAAMDSDALSTDVAKLARGIMKVKEVMQLNEETGRIENNQRFSESMKGFLTKAEQDIARIQSQENSAFSWVKELTEYFHGNLAKEEAHPLRIFMVVRDFLGVLDQVCKEVGKINDRTVISATRLSSVTVNAAPPLFPGFTGTHQRESSSDDESIVLT